MSNLIASAVKNAAIKTRRVSITEVITGTTRALYVQAGAQSCKVNGVLPSEVSAKIADIALELDGAGLAVSGQGVKSGRRQTYLADKKTIAQAQALALAQAQALPANVPVQAVSDPADSAPAA